MGQTSIQWTDQTWNPVVGCSMCSSGCAHCYAETMSKRIAGMARADIAAGKNPGRKRHYLNVIGTNGKFNGTLERVPEALTDPFGWQKPRRVFVNSMSDLFHPNVPFDYIDRVFAVMAMTPQHTYQILTKRPERMAEYFATFEDLEFHDGIAEIDGDDAGYRLGSAAGTFLDGDWSWEGGRRHVKKIHEFIADSHADPCGMPNFDEECDTENEYECKPVVWPLPNVWLGTSVENRKAADERIPHILKCPAVVRFLSVEPLLEPVEFSDASRRSDAVSVLGKSALSGIHWVIVGCESGPGKRQMKQEWAESIVKQCRGGGVACFMKQMAIDGKVSGDIETFPTSLRVREFPKVAVAVPSRHGRVLLRRSEDGEPARRWHRPAPRIRSRLGCGARKALAGRQR